MDASDPAVSTPQPALQHNTCSQTAGPDCTESQERYLTEFLKPFKHDERSAAHNQHLGSAVAAAAPPAAAAAAGPGMFSDPADADDMLDSMHDFLEGAASGEGALSPICESNSPGTCKGHGLTHLQQHGNQQAGEPTLLKDETLCDIAASFPGDLIRASPQQQQQHVASSSDGGSYSAHANLAAAAGTDSDSLMYTPMALAARTPPLSQQQQHGGVQYAAAGAGGSTSAAACSSATAGAPYKSAQSGFVHCTPSAAAAAGGQDGVARSQGYQGLMLPNYRQHIENSAFSNHTINQGVIHIQDHNPAANAHLYDLPGQHQDTSADQGLAAPGCHQGTAGQGQHGPGFNDTGRTHNRERNFRSSSTNPALGTTYTADMAQQQQHQAAAEAAWRQQQQHQQQGLHYQPPSTTRYATADSPQHGLSAQYQALAAQQQVLRNQLTDLQQKERVLLQRQASASAAAAPAAAAASRGLDPHIMAAWHSFTTEGIERDRSPPSLPHLKIRSAPAAAAAAAPDLYTTLTGTAAADAQQHKDQGSQQQQQEGSDMDGDSPVCIMDSSSGGSNSSDSTDKQQVAAVVEDLVNTVVAQVQLPAAAVAAAAEAEDQDELTSSGDNGHSDDDVAAAAAAMTWSADQLHSAGGATAAAPLPAVVLAPTDSCSPMLPSSRRRQQQQGMVQGSNDPLAAAAATAGQSFSSSRQECAEGSPHNTTAGNHHALVSSASLPGNDQGPPVMTPRGAALQSGPPPNNVTCVLDDLDFNDDLVPADMLLDDLLDSPPPAHRAVLGQATAAAGNTQQQQQQQDCGTRRPSWAASPGLQQQQQQRSLPCTPQGTGNSRPMQAVPDGTAGGMHAARMSNSEVPPLGPQHFSTQSQPQQIQVASSGLHHLPSWHGHLAGRPTVTTGTNQGFHHTLGPHIVSTYQEQQQQEQEQEQQHRLRAQAELDYLAQRGHSMIRSGGGLYSSNGAQDQTQYSYAPFDNRVDRMASCPPGLITHVTSVPSASGYNGSSYQQQQQQQQTVYSPRTQIWSGLPSAAAAAVYEGWQQETLARYSTHEMETNTDCSTHFRPSLQQYSSRTVVTGDNPAQHWHHQQQQQQMAQAVQSHERVGSPFGKAQTQNAHFRSLGMSGPLSGPGSHRSLGISGPLTSPGSEHNLGMSAPLPGSDLASSGLGPQGPRLSGPDLGYLGPAHNSLRVSGPGYPASLRLPGPHQQLSQHSFYTASYPNHGLMQPQQQHHMTLQSVGSAPVIPGQLHMQQVGAPSYGSYSGYNTAAVPGSVLRPAPSAPHVGPGCNNQGLYSQGSMPANLSGAGYSSAPVPQHQQPMKIKLKVQVQPVKRGRGRPPSRARLAAKEVDIIPVPVPVRDDSDPGGPGPTAAASGIKYLDTPSTCQIPVQHYGIYSSAAAPPADLATLYVNQGLSAAAAATVAAAVTYGSSDGVLGVPQLQRKRSGQISGLPEAPKSVKSMKLESSGSERANSFNSNCSGNSGGSVPKKKSPGMPMPIIRNGVMIPPPAGPEMTARGKPTFADLVGAGAFPPGTYEFSVGTVQSVTARISSGGVITYEDEQYQSISSFALAAARSRNPNRQACDGWKEVRLQGKKLELWRQAFLNKLPPPAIPPGCIKMDDF